MRDRLIQTSQQRAIRSGDVAEPQGTRFRRAGEGLSTEIDADWYPTKAFQDRKKEVAKQLAAGNITKETARKEQEIQKGDLQWSYMVDLSVMTPTFKGAKDYPVLAMAVGLSKPNSGTAEAAINAAKNILARGHRIERFTTDQGYADLNGYAAAMADLGVARLTDYKDHQLGQHGDVGGAIQAEGEFHCAATPQHLLDANKKRRRGEINDDEQDELLEERKPYRARNKERPDENGRYPIMCPAIGPQATVSCPLRELHANAAKKNLPEVDITNLPNPELLDRICTQHSVSVQREDAVQYRQALRYKSKEWRAAYRTDRNTVESFNRELKHGTNNIDNPTRRRVFGRANAAFVSTMIVVASNLRKILDFLRDESHEEQTKTHGVRRRDRDGLSDYYYEGPRFDIDPVDVEPPDPSPRT